MMQWIESPRAYFSGFAWHTFLPISLAMFVFAIPLNNTLQSVCFAVALMGIVLYPNTWLMLSSIRKQPWVVCTGLMCAMVLVACFWSPASWADMLYVVKKYAKLLVLPVLAVGFAHKQARAFGIMGFLAAMALTSVVAFTKALWPALFSNQTPGFVFRNYIMTGHMTALASYLALYFCMRPPHLSARAKPWLRYLWSRPVFALLFTLFSVQLLFLSLGRTGYVVYFILMVVLALQLLPWKQSLVALVCLSASLGGVYELSPKIQQGVSQIQANWVHYQQGDKDTSLGFRIQFQQFAWAMFKESPWIGHGTGSFTHFFAKKRPVLAWKGELREPHNQYVLMLAEFGVLGFGIYVAWLFSLFMACRQLKAMRAFALAIFVPFLVGCLSDSLLFYSASGYFVLALLALCLGERVAARFNDSFLWR